MGKRSAVRKIRNAEFNTDAYFEDESQAQGHSLYAIDGGWTPDDEPRGRAGNRKQKDAPPREQSYTKNVKPRSEGQAQLMKAIDTYNLVCALGPAGTGKTYLAITKAVEALQKGEVGRIVLARPAVEAGEQIGFLPGAMEDKLAPYLRPLYDALSDRLSPKQLKEMLAEGVIEIAPIGFMRGRTLNNAFVVVDEAQNCTYTQIKMLLTRLGWHSTMVVTGDPAQSDLLPELSGLKTAADKLEALNDVAVVRLQAEDVVRHPLVAQMLDTL
ncbi:MAG: phosphate starvation-inducible protein PhoH [Ponticaulis sp.]|nr:phosphate starvation-inducible protein PhoH [Ponticaulis sp.]